MRYFFHLRERGGVVPDEEGIELDGVEAARRTAVEGARSLMASDVRTGKLSLETVIEVEDESGNRLLELPFRDAVQLES